MADKVADAVQAMLEPRRAEQEHRRYLDASRLADTYRKERDMWKTAAEAEALIGKELLARAERADAEMVAATAMIAEIEKRFPNWRGYRDLVDCIDVTLHQMRNGA